jgi:hypothetical protein
VKAWKRSLALLLVAVAGTSGAEERKKIISFSALEVAAVADAKNSAAAWLKAAGRTDADTQAKFDAIWKQDASVLQRVTDTLVLGSPEAAKLLKDARDPNVLVSPETPAILKDAKQPAFLRANLAVAYARALSQRRAHDEALEALKQVKAEQVVDPASYLFYRSLSEHALLMKADASKTIFRLIEDVSGSPERYKTVAALMLLDMQTWKEKDLGAVGRKMNVIKDRLEIAKGGPQTQKLQKEVIMRLDEIIKELENKQKQKQGGGGGGGGDPNGGGCPSGGEGNQPGSPGGLNPPSSPAQDAGIAGGQSTGRVDAAKMKRLVEQWGVLPPKEREQALQKLTENLSPRHREAIENYFRNIAEASIKK